MTIGELVQLKAANQLFQRGWRYIKTNGVWIARIKHHQLDVRTTTYESGTDQFFNVNTWQRERGHFTLAYEELAEQTQNNGCDRSSNATVNHRLLREKALEYLSSQNYLS